MRCETVSASRARMFDIGSTLDIGAGRVKLNDKAMGVIGAGVIGIGVAQCFASADYRVVVLDNDRDALSSAQDALKANLRMQRLLSSENGVKAIEDVLRLVKFTTDYEELAEATLVVENVTEEYEVKSSVYRALDDACSSECVFAANTSCISISRLASVSSHPSRVIGAHFMNPVPMKSTVEVIPGRETSEGTLDKLTSILRVIGKDTIVVKDSPGFVSNRVLMPTINEAIFLVYEGVSNPEDIDLLFRSCFGHKMGPLETADLIGLDTVLASIELLFESFRNDKYTPCPMLVEMVKANKLGRKSGKGFYSYGVAVDNPNVQGTV